MSYRHCVVAVSATWFALNVVSVADTHTGGVPSLSSRPGATYTIYLDFGGFNFTGGWGGDGNAAPGNLLPYDNASSAGAFNAAEQNNIRGIWARTAEKYVGMNVNVTTVDPAVAAGMSGSDFERQAYYDATGRLMHTVVAGADASNAFIAGGGISYVGVTQNAYTNGTINGGAGRGYHTNWAFTSKLGGAGALRNIAECGGHENGHGLKLNHQRQYNGPTLVTEYDANGTSSGSPGAYAPVMGVSYYSARGLWRSGPTSSSTTTQNDVATLMSNSAMGGFIDDAVGHSRPAATALSLTAGGALVADDNDGWIVPTAAGGYSPLGEASYTQDYYSLVTTGGALNVTINESNDLIATGTADGGGTLDSVLRLLDAGGNVLTSVTNPDSQASTLATSLAAGTYFLQVVSAGGKTSNDSTVASYFDSGSYFLTGSVSVPEPGVGVIVVFATVAAGRRRRAA